MALYKPIETEDGIVLDYHRITSLNIITNVYNIIEVQSYISQDKRQKERVDPAFSGVYVKTEYISVDYKPDMSIDEAYDYLKQLDKYKGAENC